MPALETEAARLFAAFGLPQVADLPAQEVAFYRRCAEQGSLWLALPAPPAAGAVAGFAAAAIRDGAGWLVELDVLPAHARRGLGTRLLHQVKAWALDKGLPELVLTTFRDLPFNAPFYRRQGFRVIEPGPGRPHLAGVRTAEKAAGLDRMAARVAMVLDLQRPGAPAG